MPSFLLARSLNLATIDLNFSGSGTDTATAIRLSYCSLTAIRSRTSVGVAPVELFRNRFRTFKYIIVFTLAHSYNML